MKPVNKTAPQIVEDRRALIMEFNEDVFDASSVYIIFTSNCTSSVMVDYSNPVQITIPDTGVNTGQCQYSILLVDTNSQQIGYPIIDYFVIEGTGKI